MLQVQKTGWAKESPGKQQSDSLGLGAGSKRMQRLSPVPHVFSLLYPPRLIFLEWPGAAPLALARKTVPSPPELGGLQTGADFSDEGGMRGKSVGGVSWKNGALGFGMLDRGSTERFRGHWKHRALKIPLDRCISRR